MSGALYALLAENEEIRQLGIPDGGIYTDWSADTPPRDGMFVILRWGPQQYVSAVRTGPRDLDVWVHQPLEWGTDFTIIRKVTEKIRSVLEQAGLSSAAMVGEDGIDFIEANYRGHGGNVQDPGFNTLTMRSSYTVLLRTVV